MNNEITSIRLKEETRKILNQFKLDNNFRSIDDIIKFLLNFFIETKESEEKLRNTNI